jgi:MFS family permease
VHHPASDRAPSGTPDGTPDGAPDRTPDVTSARARGATLGIASLAVLLAAADTYVVVLALPDMMLGVGLGIDELQRATPIVSAFLLGYVATLPLIGRLADLRGCRPVLIGCMATFALGCLITAAATDLGTLVAGRALQGVGGGGLVPATLALVAQLWPAERRGMPLGVVGAVQETGATVGPLLGAAILAVSGWRAIFWANLAAAAVLAAGLVVADRPGAGGDRPSRRPDPVAWAAAALSVTALSLWLLRPEVLLQDVTLGLAWTPLLDEAGPVDPDFTSPLCLAAGLLTVTGAVSWARRAALRDLLAEVDAVGSALIAAALAALVLAFATADPQVAVVSPAAPLLLGAAAVALAGFVVRQRTARRPLIPRGTLRETAAWGALVVNLLVGAALVAALVDVPVFARATTHTGSQLGAALVLVRLLVAMPVGAFAGGWAIRRWSPRVVAAAGMALAAAGLAGMTRWDQTTLTGAGGTLPLVTAGLGFGLAIAPVNAALLAATRASVHGIAAALVVVARMVGMLAGLSILTAVGLWVFYEQQERIGTPLDLCPRTPADCPAYTRATEAAVLTELHAIFAAAAGCAVVAAVLCLALLRTRGGESIQTESVPTRF